MRLKQVSLLLFALSVILTFVGAIVKIQSVGAPGLGNYLLGGGFSLLIAACIGLYLVAGESTRPPRAGAQQKDDRVELPELQKRPGKHKNLR